VIHSGEYYYQHPDNHYHQYLGGNISGQYHHENDEQSTFSVPHPVGTIERSVSRSSKGGDNVETSSQVARSIVSGLFRQMPRFESETSLHVSSPSSGPGSNVSHVSSHHVGSKVDQIEEEEVLEEIEMQAEEMRATKSLDNGSGEKTLADTNLETFSDEGSELSEGAKKARAPVHG